MELVFEGGSEIIKLDMDRNAKRLIVRSSKTNYEPKQLPWKMLFDKGRETVQESITTKFNDKEFETAITHSMQILGYKRKSAQPIELVELPNAQ